MTALPRVSVVIPTFQSESRIGPTLARLGHQTLSNFEVVVVNGGSTDDTSAAVRRCMADDPRVRLVEQANGGIAAARNRGIAEARAELVAFLDDDDLWHPRKLERQVTRIEQATDASVVSCFSALVDRNRRVLGWRIGGVTEGDVYRDMLEWDMVSGGSVALVKRRALEDVGGLDVAMPDRADWELWIRLARRHRFACVPEVLVGYTRRPDSVSQRYERMIACGRAVLDKARREDATITDTEFRRMLTRDRFAMACFCVFDGQQRAAWDHLSHALRAAPGFILSRPRRLGIITMLAFATVLPMEAYERVLAELGRFSFALERGCDFDSLA